uniref:antiviral innate immune response receptor RIG-I-like isoform X1 n=1 Tax=Styela clava TaxID=7725 RepID=UPI0019393416|nr:antiviral innate immune response receptor RIG-I-like isoform X1 [Styela clava]
MSDIEQNVKKLNTENEAKQLSNIPSEKAKQVYMNWTNKLKQHGKLHMSDQDAARKLITYSKHLKMYHCLLDLKNLIPQAMLKTNEMVDFVQNGSENIELEKKNEELLKMSSNIELPMIERLVNILTDEFKKNSEARYIIFVKMRLTASGLEECFMNNNELKHLNPKYLIGTHANKQSEAMTKDSQESVLKSFREGVTKVLIATSVAEEGLDIPACNLVIMFNYVTGEVGRIQRKGRGRAVDSRAIVITSQESDHLRKEEDNKICSEASDIAIQDVKNMTEEKLKMQITDIQKKQREDRDIKRKMANKSSKTKESPSKWKVLCGDCGSFITSADKLRHIDNTHTVVMDEKFHGRMKKQAMDMKKGPTIRGKGNFLCYNPKCGIKIALNLVHKKTLFPTLSIKKIKLQRDDGKVEIPGKRSNLPFAINKSVHEADDEEMQKSFDDNPEDGDEEMLDEDSLLYDEDDTYELLELI